MPGIWTRGVAVLAALLLVLASCGDDDTDDASDPSSDPDPETVDETDGDDTADPVAVALSEPGDVLAASLSCPDERRHPEVPGVLLVPGTGLGSEDAFSLTLVPALEAEGHDVCTVDLVDSATGDITRSAEHVVAAIRTMNDQGYDEVAVVGFSQGVLAARWALTFWPDVREPVTDLVGVAGPSGGAATTAPLCADAPCAAALHQMTAGSAFLTALDDAWPDLDSIAVTLIASDSDTVVAVDEVDAVPGANLVLVQDVCEAREVDHVAMLADAVVFEVILDAVSNDGTASAERIDSEVCGGTDIGADGWDADAVNDAAFGVILTAAVVEDEPPLPAYAAS